MSETKTSLWLHEVERLIRKYDIDCDFQRLPAFTYTCRSERIQELEEEAAAARKAGLETRRFIRQLDLPFAVKAAVRLNNQARPHPGRYCAGLTDSGRRDHEEISAGEKLCQRKITVGTGHGIKSYQISGGAEKQGVGPLFFS